MSIQTPERVNSGEAPDQPPLRNVPDGTIGGLFYEERDDRIIISYNDFVNATDAIITARATERFRARLVKEENVPIEEADKQSPDQDEIKKAIYSEFDGVAIESLVGMMGLFRMLKQNDLPPHMAFIAPERPSTPWEGPVQRWLDDYRKPFELTGGIYGMYDPDEFPQLTFQTPDGVKL